MADATPAPNSGAQLRTMNARSGPTPRAFEYRNHFSVLAYFPSLSLKPFLQTGIWEIGRPPRPIDPKGAENNFSVTGLLYSRRSFQAALAGVGRNDHTDHGFPLYDLRTIVFPRSTATILLEVGVCPCR